MRRVQRADRGGLGCRLHIGIAGLAQHAREQQDIGVLVIRHQDAGGERLCRHIHGLILSENSSATFRASMNSSTLIGLVM